MSPDFGIEIERAPGMPLHPDDRSRRDVHLLLLAIGKGEAPPGRRLGVEGDEDRD
jgi:hypothetical protein